MLEYVGLLPGLGLLIGLALHGANVILAALLATLVVAATSGLNLLATAMGLGAGTFTMTALPGTPSVQNVISAAALETDL